jgi:subtilisin family serine protease
MRANAKGRFATSGVKALDSKLAELGVSSVDQLMPLTGKNVAAKKMRAINGQEFSDIELNSLYVLKFDTNDNAQTKELIENLKNIDAVEYAEPNYLVHSCAVGTPTDPLYSQQWGIPAIKLDQLWQQKTISDRMTIAILDTGVDIDHPDLKDNIWSNYSEVNGAEGADDDGNGLIDDLHGWDFVNQSGTIDDYNGHGTHCAGIAAASGNNGVGVIGANPDAWILPVTVMQSNGTGDIATIIKGIDYAASMGADVISMSFGTYSNSIALEQALGKAYDKSVLVAAAGNDNLCIYPHKCPINQQIGATSFPAGYTFVLGVQASTSNGDLASFSNYDEDGPIYSTFSEDDLYNYEIIAPGTSVISTYPNGQYKALNGTSMACPLVAGAISRLMQCKSYGNKETLFADIIHASGSGVFDALATYNITDAERVPTLNCIGYTLDDSDSGDGDLRADAGETLAIYPTLKNLWGLANNVKIWLTMGENEDASLVEFLDDKVDFGVNLNSYAKAKALTPLRIKIADKTVDGRIIKLQIHATCDNISSDLVQNIELTVENGVEIGGLITEDTTLEPNIHYIVTRTLGVPAGVTLTIKPGAVLKFYDNTGVSVGEGGSIIAVGEPGNMITFMPADLALGNVNPFNFNSTCDIRYCKFDGFNVEWQDGKSITGTFNDCIFKNISGNFPFYKAKAIRSNIDNFNIVINNDSFTAETCNITNNFTKRGTSNYEQYNFGWSDAINAQHQDINNNLINNRYGDAMCNYEAYSSTPKVISSNGNYLGSAREDILRNSIFDINNSASSSYAQFDMSTKVDRAVAEAHGCVWKVVVDGFDAQDEFEQLPPLGVGRQKFEVYFNRKMNTAVAPTITMGVRAPYTQTTIGEDGSWNEAGDTYTAYVTLNGKSDIDGTNRIYVYGAEDDEYFEIPDEQSRFNVIVQAAGSMSAGFMAEAGLGKVALTWESPEENYDDMLGYNMYRYTIDSDGNENDTIRVNTRLLDSEEFTDYSVVPGTTYYYYYKVMSTSLEENSPSKVVAATPLTASKGDANGSMDVDVADVVTEVAYMLGQNPQPFIYEAADVNNDDEIDVLDVVGTVNIIQKPAGVAETGLSVASTATYSIEDGILYIDSPVDLGGVQLRISTPRASSTIEAMDALTGFEQIGSWQDNDSQYLFLAFSLSGKTIPAGKTALMKVGDVKDLDQIVLSDVLGKSILVVNAGVSGIGSVAMMQMTLPYPNPFENELTVPFIIGQEGNHDVVIKIVDINGRAVKSFSTKVGYGKYGHTFATESLAPGLYFLNLVVDNNLMQSAKVIKK